MLHHRAMSNERTWRSDFSLPRVAGFVLATIVALIVLPMWQADAPTSERIAAQVAARKAAGEARAAIAELDKPGEKHRVHVAGGGDPHLADVVVEEMRHAALEPAASAAAADATVQGRAVASDGRVSVTYRVTAREWEEPKAFESSSRVGGWESVLPPLFAILIALFFRRLIVALAAAVWLGGTITAGWNPLTGLWIGARDYVWGSLASTFNLYIIAFTLALIGMVQVIGKMGGIAGILVKFRRFTRTARSTRVTTALLGFAVFFDDYANTVVVGTSMRPVADRRGISREKLAYIVDSTSAPVAGLAIISTWIGYEVGLFGELAGQLGLDRSGYDIFFSILPLRFYCLFSIFFVIANSVMGRDFGPMLAAERRAAAGEVLRPGAQPLTSTGLTENQPADDIPHRWFNAAIPILLVLFAAIFGLFWSGWSAGELTIPAVGQPGFLEAWVVAGPDLASWEAWRAALGNADSAKVLFCASVLGSVTALLLATSQKLLTPREALTTYLSAVPGMWLAVAILVLAWSIRAVCDDVGTSIYLVGAVQDVLAPAALPIVTFLLAAVVAFATGTSWGTMGILLPAMVPLAFYLTDGTPAGPMILLLCFGAVLDGAIFGDHCSPISDTTVMSSISAS